MLPQRLHQHITELLSIALQKPIAGFLVKGIGGGSINQTYQLQVQDGPSFFCKINSATRFPHLFIKEKRGLELLHKSGVVNVPQVIGVSQAEDYQVLLLEWIESGTKDKPFFKHFGAQLAALHGSTHSYFGLDHDNYMGSVPQQNTPHQNWISFFSHQRLQPLVHDCLNKNLLEQKDASGFENLYQKLPQLFEESQPPALLHGDLWSGNYRCSNSGEPVLIDPAVYYGHPAMDLGMTTLFGGFDTSFYESYHYHLPPPSHYKEQWAVCNLYPLLIHLYLFGVSYRGRIRQTLKAYA